MHSIWICVYAFWHCSVEQRKLCDSKPHNRQRKCRHQSSERLVYAAFSRVLPWDSQRQLPSCRLFLRWLSRVRNLYIYIYIYGEIEQWWQDRREVLILLYSQLQLSPCSGYHITAHITSRIRLNISTDGHVSNSGYSLCHLAERENLKFVWISHFHLWRFRPIGTCGPQPWQRYSLRWRLP